MFTKRFGSVPHYKIVAGERERETATSVITCNLAEIVELRIIFLSFTLQLYILDPLNHR